MLLSRSVSILKNIKCLTQPSQFKQVVRYGHDVTWNYRVSSPPAPKNVVLAAELIAGFGWWWVLWHLWTEPGHIIGEFPFPDASQWTDEELGIPPDTN